MVALPLKLLLYLMVTILHIQQKQTNMLTKIGVTLSADIKITNTDMLQSSKSFSSITTEIKISLLS